MGEKLRLVEKAIWDGVSRRRDEDVVVESGWVQQTTPHAPAPHLNGVYRCEIDDDSISERVRQTVRHYRELRLPFRWKVGPSARPSNLREMLAENGLEMREKLFGLFADPRELKISYDDSIRVEALTVLNLENWLKVQASAWGVPPQGILHMRRNMENAFARAELGTLNFLAYLNDEPVGSGALTFFDDYGLLQGAAVNPDARKRGVYRALIAHRMSLIAKRGLPAIIHCVQTTSAPICLKLGFEKVCEIDSFEPAH